MAAIEICDRDLSNQPLEGSRIVERVVKRVRFDGANLSGADLTRSQFLDCSFQGTNFEGATLTRALFENCDFRNARFVKTMAADAIFRSATVLSYGKKSTLAVVTPVLSFDGATLERSDFTNANLNRASLQRVKATDVDFTGADLRGAVFEQCCITGSQFSLARLEGADFSQTEDAGETLPDWAIGLVKLTRSISPTELQAKLKGHEAWVASQGQDGLRLILWGADLCGIELAEQDLSGADMRNCRLDFADLSGSRLVASDLRGASLIKTDLRNSDLRAALLSERALVNAHLEGARQ